MSNALKFAAGGSAAPLYVDDVFSAYTYTGNGSTQAIVNGIDLAGEGGLTWFKGRDVAAGHMLFDTSRWVSKYLISNLTNAEGTSGAGERLTSFNSDGFTLGTDPGSAINAASNTYASWTFRNAPDFYHHDVVTKSAGSNATYNFSTITTLGMVRVKRTDAAGSWYIWHRSLSAGKLLIGETTAAEATLGHITVSGNTVTLVNGVIADGTYLVEAFAHDTSADGLIQCGSVTTNVSGNMAPVSLGWEPQYVQWKKVTATSPWDILDSSRAYPTKNSGSSVLSSNTSSAEATGQTNSHYPVATGFTWPDGILDASSTYIYLVIPRSNKPPTSGTQVYNAIARTGTSAAATVTGVGFAPDSVISGVRSVNAGARWWDRLRGPSATLYVPGTGAEGAYTTPVTSFNMDGISLGTDADTGGINESPRTYINHFFRRAPGFFDEVCATAVSGAFTSNHNLTVSPELVILKPRSEADHWSVYHAATDKRLLLNSTGAAVSDTYFTVSASVVSLAAGILGTSPTVVAYLFATLAGISKVGSYTGNGSSQTIDCGFSGGARFVLIIRTDSTGDRYIWDTVRGIVAGNDPHTSLNSTAAEVTTDDSIDPDASGFIVNQVVATDINVNAATYIYLAIA